MEQLLKKLEAVGPGREFEGIVMRAYRLGLSAMNTWKLQVTSIAAFKPAVLMPTNLISVDVYVYFLTCWFH